MPPFERIINIFFSVVLPTIVLGMIARIAYKIREIFKGGKQYGPRMQDLIWGEFLLVTAVGALVAYIRLTINSALQRELIVVSTYSILLLTCIIVILIMAYHIATVNAKIYNQRATVIAGRYNKTSVFLLIFSLLLVYEVLGLKGIGIL